MDDYPAAFEADVELSDGGTAFVRPVRPDDGSALVEFHARQSPESIYYRFFSPHPNLSEAEVEHFVTVDHQDRFALVAMLGDELIGVARYDRPEASRSAEVAFFIDDANHGRGLATILLEHLAEAARERGIDGFWATVLPDNRRMVSVFRQAGFGVTSRFSDGVIEVELTLEPTVEAAAAIEARARQGQQEAVRRLLEPAHIAVIGAGVASDGFGRRTLDSILDHDYRGRVSVVHPTAGTISGVTAVRSIVDVDRDEPVDLAVIAIPAVGVAEVLDECGRAGVGAAIVLSAGFAEVGDAGLDLQAQLLDVARRHGMRLLGPNCLGLINTDPDVRLHATFLAGDVEPGGVAIMSQSGTMGGAILEQANRVGLGISSFVSVGNKADVSGNDLLSFWGDDPRTQVVLMYLESFGNPHRFARIAREVSLRTPILAIRAGRRHPDRDSGLDDATIDTLLASRGVVRVDGIGRLLDAARVLSCQGVPAGSGLALVGNSGGALRIAADTAAACGLDVAVESDLGWDASVSDYEAAVGAAIEHPDVDQVLVVFAPADRRSSGDFLEAVRAMSDASPQVPVLLSVFGPHPPLVPGDRPVPVFDLPDDAVRAAGHAATYGRWRGEADETDVGLDLDATSLRAGVSVFARNGPATLDLVQAAGVLGAAGLTVADFRMASSATEAVEGATALGFPVALKRANVSGPARREAEGASLDLHDADDVAAAFGRMVDAFGDDMRQAVLQRMVDVGFDVAIGVDVEASIGPVVWTRVRDGVPKRALAPMTAGDLARLVPHELPASDRDALSDALLRLATLAEHVPEVRRVLLAPVVVGGGTAEVTNAVIDVAPQRASSQPEVRRLSE